ncbi:hypothetical protein ACIBHX_28860 [Nonomuraea sp. NPDC050536]|uniref:hypothetical protein n=1 Tax=Nonomuraea sp. NPDC050536 TaxID=3364366 RepID=UPI0037CC2479
MTGKALDLLLLAAFAVIFLAVSFTVPGLANLIVFWLGLVGLLWYDGLVRHEPGGRLRAHWQ